MPLALDLRGVITESTKQANADSVLQDSPRAQLRLSVSPAFRVADPRWRAFQRYEVRARYQFRHTLQPRLSDSLSQDPLAQARETWRGGRLLKLVVEAQGRHVGLEVGLMTSHWGLGLLLCDDSDMARDQRPVSGRFADRSFGVLMRFFPVSGERLEPSKDLVITVGADAVIDDIASSWQDGDRSYRMIGSVIGTLGALEAGLLAMYRFQSHGDKPGSTELTTVDLTSRYHGRMGSWRLWGEGELAIGLGSSTALGGHDQSLDINTLGGLGRLGLQWRDMVTITLEGGYASADTEDEDTEHQRFSFHPNYRVGLLLFGEVLRLITAVNDRGARAESDADETQAHHHTGSAGAMQGAYYLQPRLLVRPWKGLTLSSGLLIAQSPQGAWLTYKRADTEPTHTNDARPSKDLGLEFDLALAYVLRLKSLQIHARIEFAMLWPGEALSAPPWGLKNAILGVWTRLSIHL